MWELRSLDWERDLAALDQIEYGFVTDRVYRVVREPLGFTLVEEDVDPPLSKRFPPPSEDVERLRQMEHAVVAEVDGGPVGFVVATWRPLPVAGDAEHQLSGGAVLPPAGVPAMRARRVAVRPRRPGPG